MINKFEQEKYYLERNPFTGYRATRDDLKFWVDRKEEIEKWKKVIRESLNNPNNNYISFIVGDYGVGKSLSIYKIEEICKEYSDVFPLEFTFLGEEKLKNPGINFIQRIFKFVNFEEIKLKEDQIRKLCSFSKEVCNIYQKIFFGDSEIKDITLSFLRGQLVPNQSQLKKLEISRKINDIDIAKEYFKGFLYLLKVAGYSTLVFIIDEFEYLFSLVPKAQRDIYFALIRGLYDLQPKIKDEAIANMVFFLGVSKEEFRKLEERKEIGGPVVPFLRRTYSVNELVPLKKVDVKELIELKLKYNRVQKRFERDLLIPYTEDFVDFIWKNTGGKPGDIIKKCGHVLDIGLKYRVSKLTKKFAIEALNERLME
jgi:hypothetical protein